LFNIDSYTVQNSAETTDDQSSTGVSNPNLFESIIIKNINSRRVNVSGCFACNVCYNDRLSIEKRTIVEVSCDGLLNCNFCELPEDLNYSVFPEDFILVQQEDSIEVAQVKLIGEMVNLKRHYLGLYGEPLPKLLRKVNAEDMERMRKNIQDEEKAIPFFRVAVEKLNLCMKLIAVHYQFDRKKLFFFYTADGRIDFRELAKSLAAEFKTRIELRQIGVRDEAKKVGGMGTCGREYCCISFLSSFKRITTQLATEQNLLSSMGKLSGPCGKLKCCLSFEVD
jgi:cell fate regulator YaaT (PSP1 superfamily)